MSAVRSKFLIACYVLILLGGLFLSLSLCEQSQAASVSITSITPTSGPVSSWVTIAGSGFGSSGTLTVGGSAAIPASWTDSQIQFWVPTDLSTGSKTVTVTAAGGSASTSFTVNQTSGPAILGMYPTEGQPGTTVTLVGTGFGLVQVPLLSTVKVGGTTADVDVWTEVLIRFKIPNTSAGLKEVKVSVLLSSTTTTFKVTAALPAPVINSLTPTSGQVGTGITIDGSNFGTWQEGCSVVFGSTEIILASWSNNQIVFTVPDGTSPGSVSVKVKTLSGTSAAKTFTVIATPPAPVIASISPNPVAMGSEVTITGSNFGSTRGDSKVTLSWLWFGTDLSEGDYTSWSASQIKFKLPSTIGAGSYSVTMAVGGQQSNAVPLEVMVEIPAVPHIDGISPAAGNPGTEITITGTGFGAEQGQSKVRFGSVDVVTYTSWSNTEIKCKAPWQPSGTVQVGVTTAGGSSNTLAFTMSTPPAGQLKVTSITPTTGTTLDFSLSVDVQGDGFLEGATLKLNNGTTSIEAANVVAVSSTQMTATFGLFFSAAGQYNVTVTNPDSSQAAIANGFTVTGACGAGSGTAILGFGLMMGLLSLSGSGFLKRRLRKNKKR
jgi:IPT/TIG domain